jgi:DNA-binding MarR family transcriptional regulator
MDRNKRKGPKARLIDELVQAARENSATTVLFHTTMAERFGLSPTDSKTLDVLSRLGPLTAGDLVEHTGLTSPSVTALIDRLEARGFVRRVRDASDRRKVIIELVPEGVAELSAAYNDFGASTEGLWNTYSTQELEVILDFLRRASATLRAHADSITRARS